MKFPLPGKVFFCLLISFIETQRPPLLGFPWHMHIPVTQVWISLIPSLQEDMPVAPTQQLITLNPLSRIIRVLRMMRRWMDRMRGITLTYPLPPLTRFSGCLPHPDPLLLRQSSGTLTLLGRPGHSRTITQLPGPYSQRASMCQTFQ